MSGQQRDRCSATAELTIEYLSARVLELEDECRWKTAIATAASHMLHANHIKDTRREETIRLLREELRSGQRGRIAA